MELQVSKKSHMGLGWGIRRHRERWRRDVKSGFNAARGSRKNQIKKFAKYLTSWNCGAGWPLSRRQKLSLDLTLFLYPIPHKLNLFLTKTCVKTKKTRISACLLKENLMFWRSMLNYVDRKRQIVKINFNFLIFWHNFNIFWLNSLTSCEIC